MPVSPLGLICLKKPPPPKKMRLAEDLSFQLLSKDICVPFLRMVQKVPFKTMNDQLTATHGREY